MNPNLLTSLQKSGLRLTATRVAICTLLAETTQMILQLVSCPT